MNIDINLISSLHKSTKTWVNCVTGQFSILSLSTNFRIMNSFMLPLLPRS